MSKIIARLYLILLSALWFFVLYGLPDIFSENYRYGEPPDPTPWWYVGLALLMASPLLLGAIFLSARGFAAHFVRVLSVVALAVTLYGMVAVMGYLWDINNFLKWITGNKPKDFVSIVVCSVLEALPALLLIALMILVAQEVKALVTHFGQRASLAESRGQSRIQGGCEDVGP